MNKTIVTEDNFDSRDLFSAITKDSIADMFSDPNSEAVASINARLQTGRSLSDAVLDEISASVNFANDAVAKDWCRFVGSYNADKATAAYAQKWLREQEMDSCTMDDIVQACCDVEDSRSYAKAGLVNKTVCRMLHDRIAKAADWNSDLPICNMGSAFTRNIRETELLYKKMMANPRWAAQRFGRHLAYISKYQWLQFQRFFGLPDIDSTKKRLCANLEAALASGRSDEIEKKCGTMEISGFFGFTPAFSRNEVLPSAKTVENALLYQSLLRACTGNKVCYGSRDADKLSVFAYLYGDTNFSYAAIQQKLNTSAELKQIIENIERPSRDFGLLDMGAIDRISAELGIDVASAEEFLRAHQYVGDDMRLEIPHDAEEAILRAMLQDAWEAWTHSGSILLDAYNSNLDARAHDEILMPSEAALYEHWRPSVRIMKAVIAADTGEYSVFDLSGEELEKAFTKSLAHTYRAYAHWPGLSDHFYGTTVFWKWVDPDYLYKAADELNAMHEHNQKLADAIAFPANE